MSDRSDILAELSPAKRALLQRRLQQKRGAVSGLRRREGDGPFPLSAAQRGLWLLDQLHPGLAAYNVGRILRLSGPLDVSALETALTGIVERHEGLRAIFSLEGETPVQRISPRSSIRLEHLDVSAAPDPERTALGLIRDELRRPFDLTGGALLRARLLRLGPVDHILVLTVHHITSDEESIGILFDELARRYQAAVEDRVPGPEPQSLRYVDYAVWEGERLRDPAIEEKISWWRERLSGAPDELTLPHDAPRPAISRFEGARYTETVDVATVERLRALAREQGATLFMVLLAAFKAMLARYSGQEDVMVGSPVSARGEAGLDGVIGRFGNTVVLRTNLAGAPTFRDLVDRVHDTTVGAFTHQDVPFERLVEELSGGRDLSRPPLVEVIFNFLEQPAELPSFGDVRVAALELDPGITKVDIALMSSIRDGALRLMWEYSTEIYSPATIARMSAHLHRLLTAAVEDPDAPVWSLPMLSAAERAAATDDLSRTAAPIPDGCLHELLSARAAATPHATAVTCVERTLTYAELDQRANGIAHALVSAGVPARAIVGVRLRRSVDLLAALLGAHKAGCAYLPLDPSLPEARLAYLLEDADPAAVLVGPGLELPAASGPTEVRIGDVAGGRSAPPPGRQASPRDAAYMIYTSGSTGQPKGVVVEHVNLVNLLASMCRQPGIDERDTLLAVTTLSFDIAALELFAPLLAGGQVIISEDGVAGEPDALTALLARSQATVMQATPSTWRMLLDAGWEGDPQLRALSGGEALTSRLARPLAARVQSLWNLYGPTETTIWSTCWKLEPDAVEVPIGLPIANTACYVLDGLDQPVPTGVVGELVIGGAGVARGYHRRPELTAERFVEDPFVPGHRMYRTGDRVRRRPDGALLFLGRDDYQVKVRGVRIELGEIEATLARHPAVHEAVVVLREDQPGDQRLVAYVRSTAEVRELRSFVAESLPASMVPSTVVALERMPLTPNGKLDRKALPRPSGATGAAQSAPPVGDLENRIAAVWTSILGVEGLGRDDDFFDLGGHSLLATRLVATLNSELGSRLPPSAVFQSPTVARIARAIEERTALDARADVPAPPLTGESRDRFRVGRWALERPEVLAAVLSGEGPESSTPGSAEDVVVFPASFQQRRVWFLDRLETADALYAVPLCMEVSGPLDADALRRSLGRLATRHEILRTTLVEHDGEPMQLVHPPGEFDFEHLRAADYEAACLAIRAATVRPFDLARGPLARAVLVSINDVHHLFALVMHHAVADGWSLQVIATELAELDAPDSALPLPRLQYGDYALWQREWLRGAPVDQELAWWRGALAGAPPAIDLPVDRPRPMVSTRAGGKYVANLPRELLDRLEHVASTAGVTAFMLLTAAVQTLLLRYTGEEDIVVGAPVSGRARPEFDGVVGYFANTLVLRTRLDGDPSFVDALARVKETTLGALAHQDVPFERLVEALAPDRDLSRNPLFQVLVMLDHDEIPVSAFPDADVQPLEVDRGVARFDLSLAFARRESGLRVVWEYSAELFDAITVERFAGHLACLLEGVASDPDRALSALPIIPPGERARLVAELDDTAAEIPERPVHELIAARAAQRFDAVAVYCEGHELTYRELDERANRLAHALIAEGAGPGVLVGLRVSRSVDLIVAIQGILRAGAAYIPLDPDYPAERVAFMLSDAGASMCVTRERLLLGFDAAGARILCLEDPILDTMPTSAPEPRAGLGDLAYVIYTSGSTGRPKGVMIEHRSLVNLMHSMSEHPGVRPGETMLGLTTPSFDLSVPDLYLPLVCGGRLALATAEQAADPRALARLLSDTEATVVQATPSTWRMLLDDGWTPARPMRIVVGGEAVPVSVAERLRDLTDEAWNFYGPTETTVWSTRWRIQGELGNEVPVGTPIANTACYVLDRSGSPVPRGVLGEMHIGGAGVARGYLMRPELSAEKFVPDPFRPGGRMYRTGDLVRVRPDGLLAFGGRRDDQVKLRGFRIELGEVTTALEQHPAVREAVVVVRGDEPMDQVLIAYVVGDYPLGTRELLEHLGATLPAHMLPNAIVSMEQLPLTPNGKLDRAALPPPGPGAGPTSSPPRTPVEEQLLRLWTDVLRRDDIGVHDNLFHVGAHSLLVTRAVARIRGTLGVDIPLRAVYEGPTVAELAEHVVAALLLRQQSDELESLLDEIDRASDEVAEAP